MDQAEGLCHRITLHFGRLNIETGVLYLRESEVSKYVCAENKPKSP